MPMSQMRRPRPTEVKELHPYHFESTRFIYLDQNFLIFIFIIFNCVCMSLYGHVQRLGDLDPSGAGVRGSCEPPDVLAGDRTWVL